MLQFCAPMVATIIMLLIFFVYWFCVSLWEADADMPLSCIDNWTEGILLISPYNHSMIRFDPLNSELVRINI